MPLQPLAYETLASGKKEEKKPEKRLTVLMQANPPHPHTMHAYGRQRWCNEKSFTSSWKLIAIH